MVALLYCACSHFAQPFVVARHGSTSRTDGVGCQSVVDRTESWKMNLRDFPESRRGCRGRSIGRETTRLRLSGLAVRHRSAAEKEAEAGRLLGCHDDHHFQPVLQSSPILQATVVTGKLCELSEPRPASVVREMRDNGKFLLLLRRRNHQTPT